MNFPPGMQRQCVVWLITGLAVGLVVGWAVGKRSASSELYSIHTLSSSFIKAVKLNKQTGETWGMDSDGNWKKLEPPQ